MEINYVIGLTIGVTGSAVIHFSQGLMQLGIRRMAGQATSTRTRLIYGIGVTLNLTAPLWVILANRFGPTVLYTSMYAAGIIVLLIFSSIKLGHKIRPTDLVGASFLIAGTVLLGIDGVTGDSLDMSTVNPYPLLILGVAVMIMIWPLDQLGRRYTIIPRGVLFGLLGGMFLALDSLLKGVAQYDTGSAAFLPSTSFGLTLFLLSFIGAAGALGMTQLAHYRNARASETIAGYDAAYVGLPVLILPAIAEGENGISVICTIGLIALGIGIYGLTGGREKFKE